MRLFLQEDKLHLAAIMEKFNKLFVGFFDGMFAYHEILKKEMQDEAKDMVKRERESQENFIKTLENEI